MTPQTQYPSLMSYIGARSAGDPEPTVWCDQLRADEAEAYNGGFADVISDLDRAQADYKAEQQTLGCDGYPYNRAMGEFLGLPIKANNEPPVGYFMASSTRGHFRLGKAEREIKELLAGGAVLRLVYARNKVTRIPMRFHTFLQAQIQLEGGNVICTNNRVRFSLSSNWSIETCYEKAVEALRTGKHYGYDPRTDEPSPTTPETTLVISHF
jgi:hypothetical protein